MKTTGCTTVVFQHRKPGTINSEKYLLSNGLTVIYFIYNGGQDHDVWS